MNRLLRLTGALPYLVVVFLNAFVDLGHKITVQNTIFKVYDGNTQVILTAIVNGLILLPFILLFSPAGFIADRYPKSSVMRLTAWMAVGLTLGITFCYYQGWFWPAFSMTFLLAVQSAIYSPAKYGYIKNLFGTGNLAEANGLVQATTIIAILLGTFIFSIAFENRFPQGASSTRELVTIAPIGWVLVIISLLQLIAAYCLPQLESGNREESFTVADYLSGKSLVTNIHPVVRNYTIRLSVIGLAVFWSVGQVMLAAFPAFAKETLAVTNTIVIQGILAATGIGIALGSWLAGRWSRGHIETGLIPVGAVGISAGLLLLPNLDSPALHCANFLFIGTMGGLFIVPLNALIQFCASKAEMGKVIAGNNLIQNISMLLFLGITVVFALAGISSRWLLILIAVVAVIGSLYTVFKLPQSLVRVMLAALISRRYKIHVQGIKNIPSRGGVLLLGNHISWIDWAILQIATPRPIRFVMLKAIYQRWYLKWFFDLVGCIPIQSGEGSEESLSRIAELLDKGDVVCLFPEGAISRNGHLGEFRRGFERACAQTQSDFPILPFYLRGLWGSQFSRSSEALKNAKPRGSARDIIVAFGDPLEKLTTADVLKRRVFDLSISAWEQHIGQLEPLPRAWIDTVKMGSSSLAIVDGTGDSLTRSRALTAAICLSRRIRRLSPGQRVGILLPTSAGGVLTNMAVLLNGQSIVNLNYSANPDAVASAIEQAELGTVFSSRRFIDKLQHRGIDFSIALGRVNLVMLEDVFTDIGRVEMAATFLAIKALPATLLKSLFCRKHDIEATAAVLFSSGSEGAPKGICLSHRNIMANIHQIADVLNMQEEDVVMASLPLFHAFGLTVNQFLPLVEGLPMICHADPTDAVGIAKAIARNRATIFTGTSTFLRLFARNSKVHPLMLESLRVVISGAEKLNPDVRDAFERKFNKIILEGYGATETSPVACVNLPDVLDTNYWQVQTGTKAGTVGMPLPGTSLKIVDPQSEQPLATGEAGMILIGGSQVMQGYLNHPEKTEAVIRHIDGQRWYVTGDKGSIDESGFLTIIDRYSRFAKVGGEMVSLGAIEENLREALKNSGQSSCEEDEFVAVNVADQKKGEVIAMLYCSDLSSEALRRCLIDAGTHPLMIPGVWIAVDGIPKLGSGKTDFVKAKALATEQL